jgi:hypothetical protein
MMRFVPKASIVRVGAALTAFVLVGCSSGSSACTESCYPPGIYIDPNEEVGAKSAEICLDSDCTTVDALAGPNDYFNGFNVANWHEGRTVELRLTVFDAGGQIIDSLSEPRKMNSSGCACGVLYYNWKGSRLHRLN